MAVAESVFGKALRSIFNAWPALKIAIENGAGGQHRLEKASWFPAAVEGWILENDNPDADEIEDLLSVMLSENFDLLIEDDSLGEVVSSIMRCDKLHREGHFKEIENEFYNLRAEPVKVQVDGIASDNDDSVSEEESNPCENPQSVLQSQGEVSTTSTSISNGTTNVQTEPESMEQDEEEEGWQQVKRGKGRQK